VLSGLGRRFYDLPRIGGRAGAARLATMGAAIHEMVGAVLAKVQSL